MPVKFSTNSVAQEVDGPLIGRSVLWYLTPTVSMSVTQGLVMVKRVIFDL